MSHYARGDSSNMICSSDEEGGYSATSAEHPSRTNSTIAQMNIRDKRNLILGTFGEAPPLPLPPVSDETDRQFWAEDELSSTDSRRDILDVIRHRRRRSVAHRNRAAYRRSSSAFGQSSSSSTENARSNVRTEVRKLPTRHRNYTGTTRVPRSRVTSSSVQTKMNSKLMSRLAAAGTNLTADCTIVQTRAFNKGLNCSLFLCNENKNGEASREMPLTENVTPTQVLSKPDTGNVIRNRIAKIRSSSKSKVNHII